jgi:hypothetical protein
MRRGSSLIAHPLIPGKPVRSLLSRLTFGLLTLAVLGCKHGQEPSPEPRPDAPELPPDAPAGKIVFQTSSYPADLYLVNADGSGQTRLTDYADPDFSPSWSGDGRQIYFISYNRDGSGDYDLYAMNPPGSTSTWS